MPEQFESPGGYVVVLFGGDAGGWCTLNKCPMGLVRWFSDDDEAHRYAGSMPKAFEPHILMVETPPDHWRRASADGPASGHESMDER